MKFNVMSVFVMVGLLFFTPANAQSNELNIISDGDGLMLRPFAVDFELMTGIHINFIKAEEGMLTRIKTKKGEGDLVISAVATELEEAKLQDLVQPFQSSIINTNVPTNYRDKDNYWVGYQWRVRGLIYDKSKIKPIDVSTYEDLADKKWKGKFCMRSNAMKYNVALVAWMIAKHGEPYTKDWLQGLKDNRSVKPSGNDRTQAKLIKDGQCEIAIMNSYYYAIMLSDKTEREWANAIDMYFPNQNDGGSFALVNAMSILKDAKNKDNAIKFIEYMVGYMPQQLLTDSFGTYPVRQDVRLARVVSQYAYTQEGITNGVPKVSAIPYSEVAKHTKTALTIIDQVGYDY